jgi:hypothetical protein
VRFERDDAMIERMEAQAREFLAEVASKHTNFEQRYKPALVEAA